jgi:hypothetical protein
MFSKGSPAGSLYGCWCLIVILFLCIILPIPVILNEVKNLGADEMVNRPNRHPELAEGSGN